MNPNPSVKAGDRTLTEDEEIPVGIVQGYFGGTGCQYDIRNLAKHREGTQIVLTFTAHSPCAANPVEYRMIQCGGLKKYSTGITTNVKNSCADTDTGGCADYQ